MQVRRKLPISTAPEELNDLLDEMSKFSWKLLEMVPPLVSQTIHNIPFCKDWHAKEAEPEWNEDLKGYKLMYYRPILFSSYEGKVSQKGWVGNRGGNDLKQLCAESAVAENAENIKPDYTLYKKPRLKVRGSGNVIPNESSSVVSDKPLTESPHKELRSGWNEETPENDTSSYYFGLRKLL